jgi:hypothetical protein
VRFDELMAELDLRKAIVFEHPNLHPTTSDIKTAMPGFMVEVLCDTTRAAGNLIFSGTLENIGISASSCRTRAAREAAEILAENVRER